MSENANDPAYPCESFPDREGYSTKYFGLSKREIFAAMAMQGFCSNADLTKYFSEIGLAADKVRESYAKSAVAVADKLIAALEASP